MLSLFEQKLQKEKLLSAELPINYRKRCKLGGAMYCLFVSIFVISLGFFSTQAKAETDSNDVFSIITIPRTEKLKNQIDDHYFSIAFVYNSISKEGEKSLWNSIKDAAQKINPFGSSNKKAVFQVQQEINPETKFSVKATKVIGIYDETSDMIGSEISYNTRLLPHKRFQIADAIRLRVSLSEITEGRASALRLVLAKLSDVPLITSFTSGGLTLAAEVIDVLAGLTPGSKDRKLVASYDIHGVEELAKIGYIAIVATGDVDSFNTLAKDINNIPKDVEALNNVDRRTLPSFVLLRIDAEPSIYSPGLILSRGSPVLELIENEVSAIKNALSNEEKSKKCLDLRSAIRYLGPLTSVDESYAVMAALKEANFDPDGTGRHIEAGCLDNETIDAAREEYPGFRFGNCRTDACRKAYRFVHRWFLGNDSDQGRSISWFVTLGGRVSEDTGLESDFHTAFPLRRIYGTYTVEGSNAVAILGALLRVNDAKTCAYDIRAVLTMVEKNKTLLVSKVSITETSDTIDDKRPSSDLLASGIPDCNSL